MPRVNQAIAAMQKWQGFASAAARSITIGTALFVVDTYGCSVKDCADIGGPAYRVTWGPAYTVTLYRRVPYIEASLYKGSLI